MDLLLHNLRTIGTHHCDPTVGEEAAKEIERLRAAIAWALGEGPDAKGKWFEPDADEPRRPDGQPIARYWWRGNLRRMTAPNASFSRGAEAAGRSESAGSDS